MDRDTEYYEYIREAIHNNSSSFADVGKHLGIGRYLAMKYCINYFPPNKSALIKKIIIYLKLDKEIFLDLMLRNIQEIEKERCKIRIKRASVLIEQLK